MKLWSGLNIERNSKNKNISVFRFILNMFISQANNEKLFCNMFVYS